MDVARPPNRRYDLDWLRVIGMGLVFLFHCARFFDFDDWHVKNDELSLAASAFVGVTWRFMMPLFFVVSAFASHFALQSRSTGRFLRARMRRLLVPFFAGTLVILIPVQVWIERASHGQFDGSFLTWYPQYFDGWYAFGGNFAWMGLHLWYLPMLFVFSFLLLPLFLLLKSDRARPPVSRMAQLFARPGLVFLVAVPLAIVEVWVRRYPEGLGISAFGGWPPLSYLVIFVTAYALILDDRWKSAIESARWSALVLAVLSTAVLLSSDAPADLGLGVSIPFAPYWILNAFNAWTWLIAFLGFGGRLLTHTSIFLRYANEAVLPFYVLHQTVIVTIAFYLRGWDAGVLWKYLVLAVLSFAVIMALYEGLVRRTGVFRFLFGMNPAKR